MAEEEKKFEPYWLMRLTFSHGGHTHYSELRFKENYRMSEELDNQQAGKWLNDDFGKSVRSTAPLVLVEQQHVDEPYYDF